MDLQQQKNESSHFSMQRKTKRPYQDNGKRMVGEDWILFYSSSAIKVVYRYAKKTKKFRTKAMGDLHGWIYDFMVCQPSWTNRNTRDTISVCKTKTKRPYQGNERQMYGGRRLELVLWLVSHHGLKQKHKSWHEQNVIQTIICLMSWMMT